MNEGVLSNKPNFQTDVRNISQNSGDNTHGVQSAARAIVDVASSLPPREKNPPKIFSCLLEHITETTGAVSVATPLIALTDIGSTYLWQFAEAGRPIYASESMDNRGLVAAASFIGLNKLYTLFRSYSNEKIGITDNTRERYKIIHDAMITAAFSGIVSGIFYSFTGHHLDKILTGGSNAFLIGFVTGPFMGLAVDSYKRLFGIPSLTRRRIFYNEINAISPIKRKTLGALITGTSIYATSCIYSYLPYEFHHDTPLRKEPIKSESFSLE